MKATLLKILAGVTAVLLILILALPSLLHKAGLHPEYTGQKYTISSGKKALVIGTNHGILNAPGETTGDPTGVQISELSHPY